MCDIKQMLDLPGSELLSPQRRIHMLRYRQNADRARCLTAGLMLRRVFGEEMEARIQTGRFGKPFFPQGPCFSLSHSGDKTLLAVDDGDIGADIEQILPWPDAVAQKVFTEAEQLWLNKQADDAAFYRLWTGKEAIMKALGLGFQLPPESFEILPDSTGPNLVCGRNWHLHWREVDGHMMCIASESMNETPEPIPLSRKELLQA